MHVATYIRTCTLICSCNLNNSCLSYSTCCCSRSSDDWKYQVTPNSRTRLTTDSTKLTTNTISFLITLAIIATYLAIQTVLLISSCILIIKLVHSYFNKINDLVDVYFAIRIPYLDILFCICRTA